jgi:small subunit ribosomal protein S1
VEKQGNLVTGFDHNSTKGAAAEEMPEMERRIQESRLQEHEEGGGGLIHPSQHTFDRESEDNELHAHDDDAIEYYVPSVGDIVIGVVVSSNHSKLDIDIGAQKLGHMFIKDLISLGQLKLEEACWKIPNDNDRSLEGPHVPPPPLGQPCVVHDDKEVLRTEIKTPSSSPVVELGTVFVMEVKGETMSGRPLLSARSVARGFAWKRIRQVPVLHFFVH